MALYRPSAPEWGARLVDHTDKEMWVQCIWKTNKYWYVYYRMDDTGDVNTTYKYVKIQMKKTPHPRLEFTEDEEERWKNACQEKGLPFNDGTKPDSFCTLKHLFTFDWQKANPLSPWYAYSKILATVGVELKGTPLKL